MNKFKVKMFEKALKDLKKSYDTEDGTHSAICGLNRDQNKYPYNEKTLFNALFDNGERYYFGSPSFGTKIQLTKNFNKRVKALETCIKVAKQLNKLKG